MIELVGSACGSSGPKNVAIEGIQTSQALAVSSSAFPSNGVIPEKYSSYHDNDSPPLAWSGAPAGAQSIAVFVQDPDAPGDKPYTHWLICDIPPSVKDLPEDVDHSDNPGNVTGAVQGTNDVGSIGYYGPHPPQGSPHHYHFQVFALSHKLNLAPGFTADDFTHAMKGGVLAKGEVVGLYQTQ
jgi:Raf kinase inhibitor-like YbhB/YbcL family protein